MAQPHEDSAPLRPHVVFTPEACGEVARALRRGLAEFERWGVSLPRGSWIEEAEKTLARIAERGAFGASDDELRLASAAVAWAVDLYHISTCLGEKPFRAVANELAKITHGRLLARDENSVAKNFLSQYWVGALLAQSKLKPEIDIRDQPGKPRPDYYIPRGNLKFAVEVKRPSNSDAAMRLLGDAGDQIRRIERPGLIVVDATDCMTPDPFQVVNDPAGVVPLVRSELESLHERIEAHAKSYSRSNKYQQVAMILTYARYWPWIKENPPRRAAGIYFRASALPYRWSRQITELSKGIQDALLVGIEQLTGNEPMSKYF
jgi:hypothetical protein